jgi:ribosomal protein S18 acetylase RimI-like enzyme
MSLISVKVARTIEDCEAVADIHFHSWLTTYRGLVPDSYLDALELTSYQLKWKSRILEEGLAVLLALYESKPAGFLGYKPLEENHSRFEVTTLYLYESHQRRGIGSALLDELFKTLPKDSIVKIYSMDSNAKAIAFYLHKGFVLTGNKRSDPHFEGVFHVELEKQL